MPVPRATAAELADKYEGLLLDAYGVLVDATGARPGAKQLVDALRDRRVPFRVVTNDASHTPLTLARRFHSFGLSISPEVITSSGTLIPHCLISNNLRGARVVVLGTQDTKEMTKRADVEVIEPSESSSLEALVLADEHGYPMLETLDATITMMLRAYDRGARPTLVLANPDLIYPRGGGRFGLTAGAIAHLIEPIARLRDPSAAFIRLGKPAAPIYERALEELGTRNVIMIGDQLETDVRGALDVGIEAALVESGVARWEGRGPRPHWLISALV